MYFIEVIEKLRKFFSSKGCTSIESYDMEVGAGTLHPVMFFSILSSNKIDLCYSQICRRPKDGRFANHPFRSFKHHQFQAVFLTHKADLLKYLSESLIHLGIDNKSYDIQFLEDNWSSPGIGASGQGWECRVNNMEISQITYFQNLAGVNCTAGEITYGLERLTMLLQSKNRPLKSLYDIDYNFNIKYGQLFKYQEEDLSSSAFKGYNAYKVNDLVLLQDIIKELIDKNLFVSAYENILKMHHVFNMLDASFQIQDRRQWMLRIRLLSVKLGQNYIKSHKL